MEQVIAAFRNHDRIQDHHGRLPLPQARRNSPDAFRAGYHADLHGVDRDIPEDSIQLGGDDIRIDVLNLHHATCILGRYGRNDTHAERPMGGERLQVRLNAGAAAAITPGDGQ